MGRIARLPLMDPLPGVPQGRLDKREYQFRWSDPRNYPLNRPYGDEFEYTSFAEMRRKWTMIASTASDFDFHGDSVGWRPSTNICGFYIGAPAGDAEFVVELSLGNGNASGNGLLLGLIDAAGNGTAANIFNNAFTDTWTVTAFALSANVNGTVPNIVNDGARKWMSIRRTGTTLQIRTSNDGVTWTSLTGGSTVSATARYFAIFCVTQLAYIELYRFNVYGPGFFPG